MSDKHDPTDQMSANFEERICEEQITSNSIERVVPVEVHQVEVRVRQKWQALCYDVPTCPPLKLVCVWRVWSLS